MLDTSIRRPLLWVIAWSCAFAVLFAGITRLPGVPYNIREIFGSGFSVLGPALFGAVLMWIGCGSALVAVLVNRTGWRFLTVPVFVLAAGLVSFLLLNAAVTGESLRDIVGSPTVWREVVLQRKWGEDAAASLAGWTSRYLVSQVEYLVRYLAFYSPIVFILSAVNAGLLLPGPVSPAVRLRRALAVFAWSAPWLYLCKLIVIDWAGTDNITELIATKGCLGLDGTIFLFLLTILLALSASAIACVGRGSWRQRLTVIALLVAAFPLSWLLLKCGLTGQLQKYGATSPAANFLLSPNRETLLPDSHLALRWSVAFAGAMLTTALGLLSIYRRNG